MAPKHIFWEIVYKLDYTRRAMVVPLRFVISCSKNEPKQTHFQGPGITSFSDHAFTPRTDGRTDDTGRH